jgi:diguanylate cyclase (GGDEF)-like protein
MNMTIFYNSALGASLIVLLIAVDYFRKFNTDNFQRKLLMTTLFALFASVVLDFTGALIGGRPGLSSGTSANIAMHGIVSLYLIARNCCFYFGMVFIDYFSHGNPERSKKLFRIVSIFLIVYAISVFLSIPFRYYFSISANNEFIMERFYIPQLLLCFIPILITIIDIITAPKRFKQAQGTFMLVFIIIIALGAVLDIIFGTTNYIWSCVTAATLYIYFFIIKSNSKIDRLTGIGNRYSCNEFIDKLAKKTVTENYTIAILELDRIKEINDTLGHLEGDSALRDLATAIKGCVRHSDFVARYTGDEFMVITSTNDNIQRLIDRIEEAIEAQNRLRTRAYQLNFSFGYDIFTTNSGKSIMDFLVHVEDLMHKCREARAKEFPTAITARMPLTDEVNNAVGGSGA